MPPGDAESTIQEMRDELIALIQAAREERERLERAAAAARKCGIPVGQQALTLIESLSDAAAVADPAQLEAVLNELAAAKPGNGVDENRQEAAIGRLAIEGHSAQEISRRLGLPLGEVELRLSLRAGLD
jgi:DNA-directed RNA polymerase specialized sigma24 family protein